MAKQSIGIGSSANDGTGDTLRDAGVKLNSVIDEIYDRLGNETDLLVNIGSGITEGQVLKWSTAGNPSFVGGNFDELTSNLDVSTFNIVSTSARDVVIKPDSTGDIKFWGGGSGSAYTYMSGASDKTRAVWMGGYQVDPNQMVNNIDFFTMNSTGNAQDFGDLSAPLSLNTACCDSHGGLGGI